MVGGEGGGGRREGAEREEGEGEWGGRGAKREV